MAAKGMIQPVRTVSPDQSNYLMMFSIDGKDQSPKVFGRYVYRGTVYITSPGRALELGDIRMP
jgi:hypothetical protein